MNPRARSLTGAGLLRTFLITWLSVVMSACAHSAATGASPSWGALATGSTAVALLVAPFARRRMTAPASSGVLAVLQIGLHAFFSATMPAGPTAPHSMSAMHGGMAPPPWMAVLPTLPMLCGHIVAAAGVAWLLRGGDLAAARVLELARIHGADAVRFVRHALRSHLRAQRRPHPALSPLPSGLPRWETPPPGPRLLLVHEVTRRGPPRRMAALG